MKAFKIFFYFCIFLILFGPKSFAITETTGNFKVTWEEPLFPSSIIWAPGLEVSKTFTVTNIGGERELIFFKAINILENEDTASKYLFKIAKNGGVLYGQDYAVKTMKEFFGEGQIDLFWLDGGETADVQITIAMNENTGNDYQGKEVKFDLLTGFSSGPPSTVTISVLGAATGQPAVCNDSKPGSAPVILSAIAGVNSATLTWSKATDPVSYYLLAYGLSSGALSYGNPNIGNQNTTSFTVNNLSGGTTYYFKVRAGNGCAPGDFSNEVGVTPTGEIILTPAEGFVQGVLGEQTPGELENTGISTQTGQTGEVFGVQEKGRNFYWWLLLIPFFIIVYLYFKNKK